MGSGVTPLLFLPLSLSFVLLRRALIFPPGCVQETRLTSEESGMKRSLLSPNPVRQSRGLWDALHGWKTGIKTEGSDYEVDRKERERECENHSRQCLHLAFCLNASYSHCRGLDQPTENYSVYSCLILIHRSPSISLLLKETCIDCITVSVYVLKCHCPSMAGLVVLKQNSLSSSLLYFQHIWHSVC